MTAERKPGANGCSVIKPKIHQQFRNWRGIRTSTMQTYAHVQAEALWRAVGALDQFDLGK